ncbi:MAG: acetate--CoA ligase family protein [Devosia sp.]|nr:acetate--CoA ligase family protein [Devosia sp.]
MMQAQRPDSRGRVAALLRPRSIAIVGASGDPRNILAGRIVSTLLSTGFKGPIYPVNPKYESIDGLRCYKSLESIEGQIDHAIIAVRREGLEEVLQACIARGVGGASIWTSGYGETDDYGLQSQRRLQALSSSIPFLGPNCMGFANLSDGIVAASSSVFARERRAGGIAIVSQSGGLAFASLGYSAQEQGLGFTYVVNIGNGSGVSIAELHAFLADDEKTQTMLFVLENEELLADLVLAVERRGSSKPVVVLKCGRSATGSEIARSHTGGLAGDYALGRQCAEQVGIACVGDVDEAIQVAGLLSAGVRAQHTDTIGAASISGGNVTLMADAMDEGSHAFAVLAEASRVRLQAVLPGFSTARNPVDITGVPLADRHAVYEAIMDDPNVGIFIPILTTQSDYRPDCSYIADLAATRKKPVVVVWNGGDFSAELAATEGGRSAPQMLADAGVQVFRSASSLSRALTAIRRSDVRPRTRRPVAAHAAHAATDGTGAGKPATSNLTEAASFDFLRQHAIPTPRYGVCSRRDHAGLLSLAADIGYPLVIKANVTETGLSDAGHVLLDLRSERDVLDALPRIGKFPGDDLLLMQYLSGVELFVSTFHHPAFGLVMTLGTGGRLVELIGDVRFLRLPASPQALEAALLATMTGAGLASGFRGMDGFGHALSFVDAVACAACATSSEVEQIEMNPVIVNARGAAAVDAVVMPRKNVPRPEKGATP